MIPFRPIVYLLVCTVVLNAKQDPVVCGTYPARTMEELYLHRQSQRVGRTRPLKPKSVSAAIAQDAGQIAVLDDSGGVVARKNAFNLEGKTVRFLPAQADASSYKSEVNADPYDSLAASSGSLLADIGDDDSRLVPLPFSFPFFGSKYQNIYVNSDGNLSFDQGDSLSPNRSLARGLRDPPPFPPLFT